VTGSPEAARRARLPALHLITDDDVLERQGFAERASSLLTKGGARVALHLRSSRWGGRRMFEVASRLADAAAESGAMLLVNDRVDVALAAGAHGVQLGSRAMRAVDARALLGPDARIGVSVHSFVEARAESAGADFLLAGMLFPSASHPGRNAVGVGLIPELKPIGLPVIGIGGVTPDRVSRVLESGGRGVAAISAVWRAPDPLGALQELLETLENT
jgi:thiamine-phosphate pyrophosphorylase